MAKIPFPFEISPSYFRKNGWFHPKQNKLYEKSLAFITWCFSRCSSEKNIVYHDCKEIELEPFEFIFGRRICSEETGLTDREIRVQQKNLINSGFLKKASSKTTNKYSVYKWVTNRFLKIEVQQNDQQATSKRPAERPQSRIEESKDIKEEHPLTPKGEEVEFILFRPLVKLSKEQYETLISEYGVDFTNKMLDILDAYKGSSGKKYKSDYHTMKKGGWVHKRASEEIKTKIYPLPNQIDRRTKNMDGSPVDSPADGRF